MSQTIQDPLNSPQLKNAVYHLSKLENPHLSNLSEQMGMSVGATQKYTETLIQHDWAQKKKKGRRKIIQVKVQKIIEDYLKTQGKVAGFAVLTPEYKEQIQDSIRTQLSKTETLKDAIAVGLIEHISSPTEQDWEKYLEDLENKNIIKKADIQSVDELEITEDFREALTRGTAKQKEMKDMEDHSDCVLDTLTIMLMVKADGEMPKEALIREQQIVSICLDNQPITEEQVAEHEGEK
jgi:predicted transcriptional regulator